MSASYLVSQGYQIVEDAYQDIMGITGGQNLETTDFVSMGKALDDFDLLDGWYGALTNRIVKTVVFARQYSAETRNILRDEQNFGAFVRKLYVKAPAEVENPAFTNAPSGGSRTQNSPYGVTTTLEADEFIFGGETTWSYEFQMPTIQIKKAFTSEAEMMAFVDGQFVAVANRIESAKEALTNSAINTSIANCIVNGNYRDVLVEYNKKLTTPLTVDEAIEDKGFLRYLSKTLNKDVKFVQKPSVNFNVLGWETFTSLDKLTLEVNTEIAMNSQYYLESDTYHNNLVSLPNYNDVPFWQTQGDDKEQSFDDCSKIMVTNDEILNGVELNFNNIVAVLRDEDAVACYFGDEYTWSLPNPRDRVSIHGYQYKKGYAVDGHCNEFVYLMTDGEDITETKGTHVSTITRSGNVGLIKVDATFADTYVIDKVYYKYSGDANYTEVVADEDGNYFAPRWDMTKAYEIKVTAKSAS